MANSARRAGIRRLSLDQPRCGSCIRGIGELGASAKVEWSGRPRLRRRYEEHVPASRRCQGRSLGHVLPGDPGRDQGHRVHGQGNRSPRRPLSGFRGGGDDVDVVSARSSACRTGWLADKLPSTSQRSPIFTGGNSPGMAQLAAGLSTTSPEESTMPSPARASVVVTAKGTSASSIRSISTHRRISRRSR